MVVLPNWKGIVRIGDGADWGLYIPPPHQCETVHSHENDHQHLGGGGLEARISIVHAVVGTGGDTVWR